MMYRDPARHHVGRSPGGCEHSGLAESLQHQLLSLGSGFRVSWLRLQGVEGLEFHSEGYM